MQLAAYLSPTGFILEMNFMKIAWSSTELLVTECISWSFGVRTIMSIQILHAVAPNFVLHLVILEIYSILALGWISK